MLPAQLVDLHHVDETADLVFYHVKADIGIQLRQKVFQFFGRRQFFLRLFLRLLSGGGSLLLFAGILRRGRVFGHIGGLRLRRTPEIAVHALHAVLRHGADHVQLL